jgi:hypothetical protein
MTIPLAPEPVESSPTQDLASSVPYYENENQPSVAALSYGEAQVMDEESRYASPAQPGSSLTATHTIVPSTTAEVHTPPEQSPSDLMRKRLLMVFGGLFAIGFFLVNRFYLV